MNSFERDKLNRLIRRRDWLDQRIAEAEANGKDLSFDKGERTALQWAIEIIAIHFEEPIEPRPASATVED